MEVNPLRNTGLLAIFDCKPTRWWFRGYFGSPTLNNNRYNCWNKPQVDYQKLHSRKFLQSPFLTNSPSKSLSTLSFLVRKRPTFLSPSQLQACRPSHHILGKSRLGLSLVNSLDLVVESKGSNHFPSIEFCKGIWFKHNLGQFGNSWRRICTYLCSCVNFDWTSHWKKHCIGIFFVRISSIALLLIKNSRGLSWN